MKLNFATESDLSETKLNQFSKLVNENKTALVLHHSHHCGHCVAMRSEFESFKKESPHHVVEVEGSVVDKIAQHKTIAKKVMPKPSEGMYFPMILVFIRRPNMDSAKKYVYNGERTADALHKFIKEKEPKKKSVKKPLKKKPAIKNKDGKK